MCDIVGAPGRTSATCSPTATTTVGAVAMIRDAPSEKSSCERSKSYDLVAHCMESMTRIHGLTGGNTALRPSRTMTAADLSAPASQYMSAKRTCLSTTTTAMAGMSTEDVPMGGGVLTTRACACAGPGGCGSGAMTVCGVAPMTVPQAPRGILVRRGVTDPPTQSLDCAPWGGNESTASNIVAVSALILGLPPPPPSLRTSTSSSSGLGSEGFASTSAPKPPLWKSSSFVEPRRPSAHASAGRMWGQTVGNCPIDEQGCCALGIGRASSAPSMVSLASRVRPPVGACLGCHGTEFTTTCGESTCEKCGIVRPYAERVSRNRNGGGPEDEDGTVRADAPRGPSRPPPPTSAASHRNQMRERLNLSNATMPRGLALVQRISDTAAVDMAILDEEESDAPRSLKNKGFRLQVALTKHLQASYRLTDKMAERARATAQAAWQRIEAHHRVCTAESTTLHPCQRDLSGCPPVLLSLICLSICLDETLLAIEPTDDGGLELEMLGGLVALNEAASFVRTHMLRIGTANEKNTNRTLIIARQLTYDAVVSRRCDVRDGRGGEGGEGGEGSAKRAGRLAVHATLSATSGGGAVAQSMRYRECRSEPSDDASSISSLGVDLPSSPATRLHGVASVRQAFAALQQTGLRMSQATKQGTMRAISSPQFAASLRTDGFLRTQSPSALAAALAYNVTIGTPPSSRTASSTSVDCMETGGDGGGGGDREGSGGGASPIRRARGSGDVLNYANAAKMNATQFREAARKVAESQSGMGCGV